MANLFSDPVFINEYLSGISPLHPDATEEDKLHASLQAIRLLTPGFSRKWSDLALLKQHWKGPIILKGIQHLEDAKQAVKAGVQGGKSLLSTLMEGSRLCTHHLLQS